MAEIIVAVVVFICGAGMLSNASWMRWLTESPYRNKKMRAETIEKMRRGLGMLMIVVAILIVISLFVG